MADFNYQDYINSLLKNAPSEPNSTPANRDDAMSQNLKMLAQTPAPAPDDSQDDSDSEALSTPTPPSASPPTVSSSVPQKSNADIVSDYLKFKGLLGDDQDKLNQVRADQEDRNKLLNLAQAAGDFGAGMAHVKVDPDYYNAQREESKNAVNQAVGDVERNRKLVQDYMDNKRAEQVAKDNRDARMQAQRDSASLRSQLAQQSQDSKNSANQDKQYKSLRHDLETFRGNTAAQNAASGVLSADKALDLVKGKDPNTLTKQDLTLLSDELGKLATGGVPTEHGIQALMPNNLQTKAADIKNFLTSNPTDAQAAEYIKKNMSYLQAMKDTSQGVLNDYRNNIIKGYKHIVRPEDLDEAKSDYKLDQPAPSQSASTPQTKVVNGKTYVKVSGGWMEQ